MQRLSHPADRVHVAKVRADDHTDSLRLLVFLQGQTGLPQRVLNRAQRQLGGPILVAQPSASQFLVGIEGLTWIERLRKCQQVLSLGDPRHLKAEPRNDDLSHGVHAAAPSTTATALTPPKPKALIWAI